MKSLAYKLMATRLLHLLESSTLRGEGSIHILSSTDNRSVSFYQNSSVWLDILDSRSWDHVVLSIGFQAFFVWAFNMVVDSWKFTMLLLYILWDDWPIFMISASKEQLQQQLEYTLLKPDCHSWWISKMQFGREDTLEERYSIKFCFKLGKMPQKHMECFRLLLEHLAWIEHQFLSGIRDSRKARSLWGMMRGVGGARKSTPLLIGQRARVTMLRF